MLNIVRQVMKSMSLGINIESTNNDKEWQNFFMAVCQNDGHEASVTHIPALFIWQTIWFVDNDKCRQEASCFTLLSKFVTGKKRCRPTTPNCLEIMLNNKKIAEVHNRGVN